MLLLLLFVQSVVCSKNAVITSKRKGTKIDKQKASSAVTDPNRYKSFVPVRLFSKLP
jgi:hypothetical protein